MKTEFDMCIRKTNEIQRKCVKYNILEISTCTVTLDVGIKATILHVRTCMYEYAYTSEYKC